MIISIGTKSAGPQQDSARRPRGRRGTTGVVAGLIALAAAGALLTGCSDDAGDETCGDFLGQSSSDQKDTTTNLLEENGYDDPSGITVGAARLAIQGYCNAEGSETPLQNAMDDFDSATDSIIDFFNN